MPSSKLRLGASDVAPELASASWPLGHLLGSAAHSSPTIHAKKGAHNTNFATQGSTPLSRLSHLYGTSWHNALVI